MARAEPPQLLARAVAKAARDMRKLDAASAELGYLCVGLAKRLAPNDTGRLARSVTFAVRKPRRGQASRVVVTASTPYVMPIHWGWPARGIPPSKFLTRALDRMNQSGTLTETYTDAVIDILEAI